MKTIAKSVGSAGGVNLPPDVKTIQELLNGVTPADGGPQPKLAVDGICGPKTKQAIQTFQLKHFGWSGADGRVDPAGPTIVKLNQLNATPSPSGVQGKPVICGLSCGCYNSGLASQPQFVLAQFTPAAPPSSDQDIMNKALSDSRASLLLARNALDNLLQGFQNENQKPLNDFQNRVLISCRNWLKISTAATPAARIAARAAIQRARALMDQNRALRTSNGINPPMRRSSGDFFGQVQFVGAPPDSGIDFGTSFFASGPKCRRDVATHEIFHMLGVAHGDGPVNLDIPRSSVQNPIQALDSADHLSQLVSEILNGESDSCLTNK